MSETAPLSAPVGTTPTQTRDPSPPETVPTISLREAALSHAGASDNSPRRLSPTVIAGALQLFDGVAAAAIGLVSYAIYNIGFRGGDFFDLDRYSAVIVLLSALLVVFLQNLGSYQFKRLVQVRWQCKRVVTAAALAILAGLAVAFVTKTTQNYSRGFVIGWAGAMVCVLLASRVVVAARVRAWTQQGKLVRNAILVGAGELGTTLINQLAVEHDNV